MSTFQLVHASLELPNGIVLSYAESGDPGGVPVVFVHGYSDSHRAYSRLLACLPSWVRAIAVTVRGHGDSSKPLGAYTIAEMASDLDAALLSLLVAQPIVGRWRQLLEPRVVANVIGHSPDRRTVPAPRGGAPRRASAGD